MSKGILRGLVLCFMIISIILVVVFIIKSNQEDTSYHSTVNINNVDSPNNNSYVEARTDDNIIDYAQNNYFAIILFSSLAFFGLLIFYAFLSKKKEW